MNFGAISNATNAPSHVENQKDGERSHEEDGKKPEGARAVIRVGRVSGFAWVRGKNQMRNEHVTSIA